MGISQDTMKFNVEADPAKKVMDILTAVHASLEEKGYNPVSQMVGYLISGDPTYITSHKNARSLICKLDRDELLQSLLKYYLID